MDCPHFSYHLLLDFTSIKYNKESHALEHNVCDMLRIIPVRLLLRERHELKHRLLLLVEATKLFQIRMNAESHIQINLKINKRLYLKNAAFTTLECIIQHFQKFILVVCPLGTVFTMQWNLNVKLPFFFTVLNLIKSIMKVKHQQSKEFLKSIRWYNCSFQITSVYQSQYL